MLNKLNGITAVSQLLSEIGGKKKQRINRPYSLTDFVQSIWSKLTCFF